MRSRPRAWITASSVITALALEHRLEAGAFVEIGKGFAFVAATGVLFYLILERIRRRLQAVQDSLDGSRGTDTCVQGPGMGPRIACEH